MAKSSSQKNYENYRKGREKLKNATFFTNGDDAIVDMVKKGTNHRFWVSNHADYVKKLSENDGGPMGTGAGNPVAPTPAGDPGSGDKFQSDKKKKKKGPTEVPAVQKMMESLGDGTETFDVDLNYSEITTYNEPAEFGEINSTSARVSYRIDLDVSRIGLEGVHFIIDKIVLTMETVHYSPEDKEGDNPQEDEKIIHITPDDTDIEKYNLPFYLTDLELDMKKSTDPKLWKIKATFGYHSN